MDNSIVRAYNELLKVASAVQELEDMQNQIGKPHHNSDEKPSAPYESVEKRLSQPWDKTEDWYDGEPMEPKVEQADECDSMPMSYDSVIKEAKGLNQRYMHPGKNASYVRKSTIARFKNSSLKY